MDRFEHFRLAARKIPVVAAGTLHGHQRSWIGLGTIEADRSLEDLAWEIGSITKVFTGLLLADMSLSGEVSLDDPVGKFLPDEVAARLPAPDQQPTLADLSSHTSGLPRIPRSWYKRLKGSDNPYSALAEDDVFAELGPATTSPLRPRPRYSNFGAGLLGHLLGRAAGASYESLVGQRILRPLAMTSSGFDEVQVVPGYRKGRPTPSWSFGALAGAGGLRSTVADMLTFGGAFFGEPETPLLEAMDLTRRPRAGKRAMKVGLGWLIRIKSRSSARDTTWHNGGTFGGAAFLAVDVEKQLAVVAFGNRDLGILGSPLDKAGWSEFDALVG